MHKIDFVVPWVDPSDPYWQAEFKKYTPDPIAADASFERYRDWGLLKYWFRGVEEYAPWVNKIHFITYGHLPEWLNTDNPKLNIVRHEDYIPQEYLPVFSSHPIELCINKIEGLAEHFVYFNDDFYITNPIVQSDFFVDGLPCDMAVQNVVSGSERVMMNIQINNLSILNKHFKKHEVLKNNFLKWFNYRYPMNNLIRSIMLSAWPTFSGFLEPHLPQPFLKSTLDKVWEKEPELLTHTVKSKFRSPTDVNQYLFKNWQLCEGTFFPKDLSQNGKYIAMGSVDAIGLKRDIDKYKMIVLNDAFVSEEQWDFIQNMVDSVLSIKFNGKSAFEK